MNLFCLDLFLLDSLIRSYAGGMSNPEQKEEMCGVAHETGGSRGKDS